MTDSRTKGAQTLADYPGEVFRLACDRWERKGRYRRPSLIEQFGADASLPDVLNGLASCARARDASDPCRAFYPDLATQRGPN
jgi:hypothetical protein